MDANVIVTGANGFVGKLLCDELVKRGYTVHALIRGTSDTLHPSVNQLIYSDLVNLDNLKKSFERAYAVIHLAAKVHIKDSGNISEYRHINTNGTTHLAEIAVKAGVKKFIYLSTIKVNGDSTEHAAYSCQSHPKPVDAYAISKWEAEQALMKVHSSTSMDVTILRPVLMYGPGVKGNFRSLMRVVSAGMPLPLNKINNKRSLLNVRNLNDLICECLVNDAAAGRTFLVSDGHDLSTTEIIRLIASSMTKKPRLFRLPITLMQVAARLLGKADIFERLYGSLQVDIDETRRTLGWNPPYSIQDGMREMIAGFKKENV